MKKEYVLLSIMLLSGCQTVEPQRIEIASYAPVIDVKGQGYDNATYLLDLYECRELGVKIQATYEAQRKKEQMQATEQVIVGILAGALIGHAIGANNDYHTGRTATTGAIAGASGSDAVDYSRTMAKFGPTGIVDRCMAGRGYVILSNEGFGGG
jgi:uncharacterized protein YcfJ